MGKPSPQWFLQTGNGNYCTEAPYNKSYNNEYLVKLHSTACLKGLEATFFEICFERRDSKVRSMELVKIKFQKTNYFSAIVQLRVHSTHFLFQ